MPKNMTTQATCTDIFLCKTENMPCQVIQLHVMLFLVSIQKLQSNSSKRPLHDKGHGLINRTLLYVQITCIFVMRSVSLSLSSMVK